MNKHIATKLAAAALAVLMNGVVLGSVTSLFARPQTGMAPAMPDKAAGRADSGRIA